MGVKPQRVSRAHLTAALTTSGPALSQQIPDAISSPEQEDLVPVFPTGQPSLLTVAACDSGLTEEASLTRFKLNLPAS